MESAAPSATAEWTLERFLICGTVRFRVVATRTDAMSLRIEAWSVATPKERFAGGLSRDTRALEGAMKALERGQAVLSVGPFDSMVVELCEGLVAFPLLRCDVVPEETQLQKTQSDPMFALIVSAMAMTAVHAGVRQRVVQCRNCGPQPDALPMLAANRKHAPGRTFPLDESQAKYGHAPTAASIWTGVYQMCWRCGETAWHKQNNNLQMAPI